MRKRYLLRIQKANSKANKDLLAKTKVIFTLIRIKEEKPS